MAAGNDFAGGKKLKINAEDAEAQRATEIGVLAIKLRWRIGMRTCRWFVACSSVATIPPLRPAEDAGLRSG